MSTTADKHLLPRPPAKNTLVPKVVAEAKVRGSDEHRPRVVIYVDNIREAVGVKQRVVEAS